MFKKKTALEKEWIKLVKQEDKYIKKYSQLNESKLNQLLADKVPDNLQTTLDKAFSKAFSLVFEKGTFIIEKTYNKDKIKKEYKINEVSSQILNNRKSLKMFSKKAKLAGNINLLFSGISGVGLGILGIGLPDIALFVGVMLKNVYEIILHYGYNYEDEDEKKFILLLIKTSLLNGTSLVEDDKYINEMIYNHDIHIDKDLETCIQETSSCLSKELLYMKFIQGIPIVGAIGGFYDAIYMGRISKYVEMKVRRRYYYKKVSENYGK